MSDDKPKWSRLEDLLKDEAFRKTILDGITQSVAIPPYYFKDRPTSFASAREARKFFVGTDPAAANGDDATVVYGTYKNATVYIFDEADPYTTIDVTAQVVEDEPLPLPAPKENEAE